MTIQQVVKTTLIRCSLSIIIKIQVFHTLQRRPSKCDQRGGILPAPLILTPPITPLIQTPGTRLFNSGEWAGLMGLVGRIYVTFQHMPIQQIPRNFEGRRRESVEKESFRLIETFFNVWTIAAYQMKRPVGICIFDYNRGGEEERSWLSGATLIVRDDYTGESCQISWCNAILLTSQSANIYLIFFFVFVFVCICVMVTLGSPVLIVQ